MTKIIYALLILLMSLACCSCDKVSRQATPKLSGGHEDNAPSCPKLCSGDLKVISYYLESNTPSDPLQVCSPAADLHTTDDEEKEVKAEEEVNEPVKSVVFAADKPPTNVEVKSEEEKDRRLYEFHKRDLDTLNTGILIIHRRRYNPQHIRGRAITGILVERLKCLPEEIIYTFYNDWSSYLLLSHLKTSFESPEEKQVMRRILNERGVTIPEPRT